MEIYFAMLPFITGVIFGSFFNVCILRIPENKSIVTPASHCYNCNAALKPIDLVPILSWIFLRGKCRYCGHKISSRYTLVEFITGIVFILIYNTYGWNEKTLYYLVIISLLIIIAFIDIDQYIIPYSLIMFGSIGAIVFNALGKGIDIKNSLLGGLICGGLMLILTHIMNFILKKEAMGGGDIKLFTMMGLFLGIEGGLLTIILSTYLGVIYQVVVIINNKIKRQKYNSMMPYGPFISIGALIVVLCGT